MAPPIAMGSESDVTWLKRRRVGSLGDFYSTSSQAREARWKLSPTESVIRILWGLIEDEGLEEILAMSYITSNTCDEKPQEPLLGCGRPILELLASIYKITKLQDSCSMDHSQVLRRLDDLIRVANEKSYAFQYKDVPVCWKKLFQVTHIFKACVLAMKQVWGRAAYLLSDAEDTDAISGNPPPLTGASLDAIVETLDMQLIMAALPQDSKHETLLRKVYDLLGEIHLQSLYNAEGLPQYTKHEEILFDNLPANVTPKIQHPVPIQDSGLTIMAFEKHMMNPLHPRVGPEPFVIKGPDGILTDWPALSTWNKASYLYEKTIGGLRRVPVEIGRSYVDSGWGQKIITFDEFLKNYVLNPQGKTGYLAQFDLLGHIPALRNDILIPDLCYTTCSPPHPSSPFAEKHRKMHNLEEALKNAWFGPAGTVSPMHTDPYHNILAQVVGRKYVRLYAPQEHENLYPRGIEEGGIDMSNTSSVDVGALAGWDGDADAQDEARTNFPLFSKAKYVETVLEPGDALYIPLGWWHYVRSLSVSFSVSFWFNDIGEFDTEEERREFMLRYCNES